MLATGPSQLGGTGSQKVPAIGTKPAKAVLRWQASIQTSIPPAAAAAATTTIRSGSTTKRVATSLFSASKSASSTASAPEKTPGALFIL